MATAIGVISGVVGIYQFLADLFPTSPDSVTATVRVAVGLSGTPDPGNPSDTLNDPAGVLGSVRIYNNNQEFLSESQTNVEIDDGGFIDMAVEQVITQQVPYVQIQGADGEDLCIAYTSVTFADGQRRSWDGSWALAYDPLLWFWSGILVSPPPSSRINSVLIEKICRSAKILRSKWLPTVTSLRWSCCWPILNVLQDWLLCVA